MAGVAPARDAPETGSRRSASPRRAALAALAAGRRRHARREHELSEIPATRELSQAENPSGKRFLYPIGTVAGVEVSGRRAYLVPFAEITARAWPDLRLVISGPLTLNFGKQFGTGGDGAPSGAFN